jgi:hypothetical protein
MGAPSYIHPEPRTVVVEQFISMCDLNIEEKLSDCPSAESGIGRDVFSTNLEGREAAAKEISVRTASAMTSYNNQYLRRLMRSGNLEGIKLGQTWLIILDTLTEYLIGMNENEDQRCGPRKLERATDS